MDDYTTPPHRGEPLDDFERFAMAARQLGESVGKKLAAVSPITLATAFVSGLAEHNETARLPELLARPEVKRWMSETGVTDRHLSDALSARRKENRNSARAASGITVPPKKRNRAPAVADISASSA